MRSLLALTLLLMPGFAQQQAPPKPEEKSAATEQKPAEAAAKTEAPAASPAPATEQFVTGSIDFGFRWLPTQRGNFQQYRSIVNLGEGFRIFGLDLTFQDPKKRLFDRGDLRAIGWGGDPYNTAHLDARKEGVYWFTGDYRNIAYFNAIPSFANPNRPAGFDERSFDIHRRMASFNLDVRPGKRIIPYLAFDRNTGYGHGIETWVNESANEYPVRTLLRDSTNNYRAGVRFEFNRFHMTLEQGGTTYKDDDQAFNSIQQLGDRTTPLPGQQLSLTNLQQSYAIRGHSIYSSGLLTAHITKTLDVYGQFLYSQPKTDVNFFESATGNFVELSSLLFYSGQQTIGTGAANQPHTTGSVGFEFRPLSRLRVVSSLLTDHYHDAASPLVATFLSTNPSPTVTGLNHSQVVNYNQQQIDLIYDLTSKLSLRGGWRYVWGDATVRAGNLSQTGPLATGNLERNVGLAGLTYRASQKLSVTLDYEGASSDQVYFRTSLNDYHRGRARARYQLNNAFTVQARFQVLDNQNPDPSIRYDFRSRDNVISLFWTPKGGKRISLMAEYDRSSLRSNIGYLGLFFAPQVSAYRDNAHTASAALDIGLPRAGKVTVGGSLFVSSGSRPTTYYQPMARLSLPLQKHIYWNTEWQWYGYGESFYLYEAFRTHVLMSGFRVTR